MAWCSPSTNTWECLILRATCNRVAHCLAPTLSSNTQLILLEHPPRFSLRVLDREGEKHQENAWGRFSSTVPQGCSTPMPRATPNLHISCTYNNGKAGRGWLLVLTLHTVEVSCLCMIQKEGKYLFRSSSDEHSSVCSDSPAKALMVFTHTASPEDALHKSSEISPTCAYFFSETNKGPEATR